MRMGNTCVVCIVQAEVDEIQYGGCGRRSVPIFRTEPHRTAPVCSGKYMENNSSDYFRYAPRTATRPSTLSTPHADHVRPQNVPSLQLVLSFHWLR